MTDMVMSKDAYVALVQLSNNRGVLRAGALAIVRVERIRSVMAEKVEEGVSSKAVY